MNIAQYTAEAPTGEGAPGAPDAREVLAELVALADLRSRLEESFERMNVKSAGELQALRNDLYRREPLAWEAARKVLAKEGGKP